MSISRRTAGLLAVAAGFALLAADVAEARMGRNFGSRGSRTYTAPPTTNTAPKPAAPIERSMTQKSAPTAAPAAPAAQPSAGAATQASRFGGLRGLLMGGLIAAALAGIFGVGALASILGFVLQFALIAGAIYLVVAFLRSRSQPAPAHAGTQGGTQAPPRPDLLNRRMAAATGGAVGAATLTIGQDDLDTFEKLLGEIQTAYSREDTGRLGDMTTPEMLSYLSQELANNAKQGVHNELSDVKLLQGDLAEAWREQGSDYATVAMRYSLVDVTTDRATGRVVAGDRTEPTEIVELWTFRRDDRAPGEGWQLSAIQDAA